MTKKNRAIRLIPFIPIIGIPLALALVMSNNKYNKLILSGDWDFIIEIIIQVPSAIILGLWII